MDEDVRAVKESKVRPFTKENAAEMARRGHVSHRRRLAEEKANPALKVTRALPDLFDDLLKAARGLPPYDTLPPDKRLAALFRALEYGAGKPISRDKQLSPADPGEGDGVEPAGGLSVV